MAMIKEVIDNKYNTEKMLIEIGDETVTKLFKPCRGYQRRYKREKEALLRLLHIIDIPRLIKFDDHNTKLFMTRLPGVKPVDLSEQNLRDLTKIVERMLAAGVARHAMPIRDILVDQNGRLSLVDFERSTIVNQLWRPDFLIAKKVSRYHLYRLIAQYQPQLLTKRQKQQLERVNKLRSYFGVFKRFRNYIRA